MGELLRSKGFLWVASTNDVIGGWQQVGILIITVKIFYLYGSNL